MSIQSSFIPQTDSDSSGNRKELETRLDALERENALLRSALEHAGDRAACMHDPAVCRRTEQELNDTRHRLGGFLSQAPGFFFTAAREGDGALSMPFASAGVTDIYGLDPVEVMRDCSLLYGRIHRQDLDAVLAAIDASAESQMPLHLEFRVLHPQKGERWIEARSVPHRGTDGTVTWHSVQHDITERRQADTELQHRFDTIATLNEELEDLARSLEEQAVELEASQEQLKMTEAWYRGILHLAPDGMLVINESGTILLVNEQLCRMFGYSEWELVGQPVEQLVPADVRDTHVENRTSLFRASGNGTHGGNMEAEDLAVQKVATVRACRKDGGTFVADMTLSLLPDAYTGTRAVCAAVRDVTERQRMQEALRDSEATLREKSALLQSMLDSAGSVGVFALDRDCRYLSFNKRHFEGARRIWGIDIAVGMSILDAIPDEALRDSYRQWADHVLAGHVYAAETRSTIQRNGEAFHEYHENHGSPIFGDNGEVTGLTVFSLNITERKRQEEENQQLQRTLKLITDTVPGSLTLNRMHPDGSGRMLYENGKLYDVFGMHGSELTEDITPMAWRIHPEDLPACIELMTAAAVQGRTYSNEFRVQHPEKGEIWIQQYSTPVFESESSMLWCGAMFDVTEHKKLEDELRRNERRFRTLVNSLPDPFFQYDRDHRRIYVNEAVCRLTGQPAERLTGLTITESQLLSPMDNALLDRNVQTVIETGHSIDSEIEYRTPDGRVIHLFNRLAPTFDDQGQVDSVMLLCHDITRIKTSELDSRKALEFAEGIINAIPDLLFEVDRDGRYLNVWTQKPELLAARREELLGRTVRDALSREAADIVMEALEEAEANDQSFGKVICIDLPQGECWFELSIARNASSEKHFIVLSRDVTERKLMERALLESERSFRTLAENTPDPIFRWDANCWRVYVNPAVERLLGKGQEELLGRAPDDGAIVVGEQADRVMRAIRSVIQTREMSCIDVVYTDATGHDSEYQMYLVPEKTADGDVRTVLGLTRDITSIRHAERRLSRFVAALPGFVFSVCLSSDGHYSFPFASPGIEEIFGLLPGDVECNAMPLMQLIYAEDSLRFQSTLAESARTESRLHDEFRVLRAGEPDRWVEIRGMPERTHDGGTLWNGIMLDVTARKQAEHLLDQREQEFRTLAENAPDTIMRYDLNCRRTYLNPAFLNLIGLPADDLLGGTPTEYSTTEQAFLYEAALRDVLESGTPREHEYTWQTASGREIISLFNIVPERGSDGSIRSVLAIGRDITERKRMEAMLSLREREFRSLIENSPDLIARYDHQFRRTYANPALLEATGRPYADLVGKRPTEISVRSTQLAQFEERLAEALTTGKEVQTKLEWERPTGEYVYSDFQIVPERDQTGSVMSVLAIGRDISQIALAEQRLNHMALHDALTGLPNRRFFHERLKNSMALSDEKGHSTILMLIDLDNFKTVNDTLGHSVGDELLKLVAHQLHYALREDDTVARLGGDEFVVIINDVGDSYDVDAGARRILGEITRPFAVAGHHLFVRASMGISAYPHDARDAEALLRSADTAMYHVKERGRDGFHRFSEELNQRIHERAVLAASLRTAIGNGEVELHYQPKMSIRDGLLSGMEALMRWNHPEHGAVPPGRFIPVAEQSALIVEMGAWAIADACRQIRAWLSAGIDPVKVSVNLSPAQCRNRDIIDVVRQALQRNSVPARYLEMEITESMVMQDAETATGIFWELREMGVSLSIDDFGTGQSSLAYLKRFPVDCLKIDRSFVSDIHMGKGDDEIVRTIIMMARSLGMRVIAEGVETHDQVDFLRRNDCDEIQGHLFSVPLPAERMTGFLINMDPRPGT